MWTFIDAVDRMPIVYIIYLYRPNGVGVRAEISNLTNASEQRATAYIAYHSPWRARSSGSECHDVIACIWSTLLPLRVLPRCRHPRWPRGAPPASLSSLPSAACQPSAELSRYLTEPARLRYHAHAHARCAAINIAVRALVARWRRAEHVGGGGGERVERRSAR